jgi:hypothetical protein
MAASPDSLARSAFEDAWFREELRQLRLHSRWLVEGVQECSPLFRRGHKVPSFGKDLFRLQTGAFKNKIGDTDASCFRTSSNQVLLALGGPDIEAPGPDGLR